MTLARGVSVIGAGMTRFHHKEHIGRSSREIYLEAALEAVDSVDKGIGLSDIEALLLGNFSSDLFEGQTHTAALMADWLGLNPVPEIRVEDACASSGVAFNVGIMAVASGLYDVVMVGGVERMRTLETMEVTDTLAMAADAEYEVRSGFTFPGLYASIASAYFKKYNETWENLASITIKNHMNGALNPKAQYQSSIMDTAKKIGEKRGISFKDELEFLSSEFNPVVAGPLRLFDCCPISDGAAAVIISSEDIAAKYTDAPVKVAGIGQASDTMALHDRRDLTSLYASVIASRRAYKMADVMPNDIDFADVHDCFTIAEAIATEDLGFFQRGEGIKATVEGETSIYGEIPVNADGGLKAKGHPVGATGAAMVYEAFKQLRGEADRRQVEDAEVGLTHNVGAAGATVAVQVFTR